MLFRSWLAGEFGKRFGTVPTITGTEAPTAWLLNTDEARKLFGKPSVPLETMIDWVADWISRGYYGQLLAAGVRILRFRDAMVHAKTATIDGSWATVGTANIDRLSLQGNYEINLEVIDPDFAAAMEKVFETDQSNCLELTLDEWEARDLNRKFTESFLAPLRPLL